MCDFRREPVVFALVSRPGAEAARTGDRAHQADISDLTRLIGRILHLPDRACVKSFLSRGSRVARPAQCPNRGTCQDAADILADTSPALRPLFAPTVSEPPSSISRSAPGAPRSAGASRRTGAGSGGSRPAGASSSGRASPSRPPVLTRRCWRLVSDHASIRAGSTRRQVPEVVREHAQLQPDLVRSEPVTRQARPMRGLFALLDPLLGRAALVVEAHDGPIGEREIRHDEADAREQLAGVVLDFATTRRAVVQLSAW